MKRIFRKIRENFLLAILLGNGIYAKMHVLIVSSLFPIEHLLRIKRITPIRLSLTAFGQPFVFYVRDSSDVTVLKEVFLLNEYALDLKKEPMIIVDLGSNVGASVVYFAVRYPNARIIAVEADPVTANALRQNAQQFSNISVLNYAIAGTDGSLTFYVHPSSRMSSSLVQRTPEQESIEVPARTFASLLAQEKITTVDLLKFDIEGAEYEAFKQQGSLNSVHQFVGEIHLDLISKSEGEMLACFEDFSYTKEPITPKRFIIRGSRKT